MTPAEGPSPEPLLTGVVVVWQGADDLDRLVAAWPEDPRFELLVVDNGCERALSLPAHVRLLEPGRNLGFAGGVNAGWRAASADTLLLLNPDALPREGALEALLGGLAELPDAAGLAPRLVSSDGTSQAAWQLRFLPRPGELLLHAFLLPGGRSHAEEPATGTPIEQPAAAALLLRRSVLVELDGFDESYYPAWFEDVDFARRLADRGLVLRYWPQAVFEHALGSTVSRLGYGRFLWIYDRNLVRYLRRHHGVLWAALARLALPLGLLLRGLLLPLRCPRRAPTRRRAARGLLMALLGALSGWRRPRELAQSARRETP